MTDDSRTLVARRPLRVLIVDDEEPARELLRSLLEEMEGVVVAGEAADGAAAIERLRERGIDVVLLDVQMPGMSGLEVAQALEPNDAPAIVFVTAYEQYAVKAFELSACDYLLKPIHVERLQQAVRRVQERRTSSNADVLSALQRVLATPRDAESDRVVVKSDGRHVFLMEDEIVWIEARQKETRFHLTSTSLDARESMNSVEGRLKPGRFVRVHRSSIVNRAHIREIQSWFKGDYVIIMRTGTRIVSGRTYRDAVRGLLGE